mgnify:CR=1 FL=1
MSQSDSAEGSRLGESGHIVVRVSDVEALCPNLGLTEGQRCAVPTDKVTSAILRSAVAGRQEERSRHGE